MTDWKTAEKKARLSYKKAIKSSMNSDYFKDLSKVLEKEITYLEEVERFEKKYHHRGSTLRGSRSAAER